MQRALALAERALYTTPPNPRVGCVVVRDGVMVGEGYHERPGEPHAEVHALRTAGPAARGAIAYVTLEPCNHFGRTPPCVDALLAAGVKRVVAAMRDPNQLAAGGAERLRAGGVEVDFGLLEDEARALNPGFISRVTRGRPWLRMKIAASLDGRTALADGRSRWITGAEARRDGHHWRARACAVLTGIGTVREDDPQLNVREVATTRQPLRIVVDSRLEVPLGARILGAPGTAGQPEVLVAAAKEDAGKMAALRARGVEVVVLPDARGKVDLAALVRELGRRGLSEVHVEAGTSLNGSLLQAGVIDELLVYLAPKIIGDTARGMFKLPELASLDQALGLDITSITPVGQDLRILARVRSVNG
jgi:diaminohydroxyphosphoribosylaminopyrimidine deaminase/5-amino-6-(5-phosphoribosylamino)uracil reductase